MPRLLSRRYFLQSTALAGAGLSLWPLRSQAGSAAESLNLAAVGVGGKGWSDLNSISASPHVNVVAICDIDEGADRLGRAAEKFPQAKRYVDWRKLLEQKDIDAVQVSTPDHMHAPISLAAMELGKHVYCQKPLTHSVHEARQMADAAQKAGVVTQMGNQIQSHTAYRTAVNLVHNGTIGKVREVVSWQSGSPSWRKTTDRPAGKDPIPEGVHWDLWLGVAPQRPYKKDIYHPFNWRNWQDFGTGQLGDFGCHILDPVFMSLKLTAPKTIKAKAPPMNDETWPTWSEVEYVFPGTELTADKTVKVTWIDGEGVKPSRDRLRGIPDDFNLPGAGSVLMGEKGTLVIPHVAMPKVFIDKEEATYEEVPGRDHYVTWADACRGEGHTTSLFSYSGPLTEAVLLGTVALRMPKETLQWNAKELRVENSSAATDLLTKSYRQGWELPS